jgi:hypothetical protein
MTIARSQWKVKAAVSLVFWVGLQSISAQSISPDLSEKVITLKVKNASLETVLQRLSEQAKLYFIYSSNSVELNRSVTLDINRRPLIEVLESLSDLMGVTFRNEGKYVVVKRRDEYTQSPTVVNKASVATNTEAEIKEPINPRTGLNVDPTLSVPSSLLKEDLLRCYSFVKIDVSRLQPFPLAITNPRSKRNLIGSVSLIGNEYAGGLELNFGLPYVYGVLNSGLMRGGHLRTGFGIGTSISVKPNISLNPVYSFARVKEKQDHIVNDRIDLVIRDGVRVVGNHHQMKLLFNIQAFPRIAFRVGPTINFLKTNYTYPVGDRSYTIARRATIPSYPDGYGVPVQVGIVQSVRYSPPASYSTYKTWVGFEGGISYSIKFP